MTPSVKKLITRSAIFILGSLLIFLSCDDNNPPPAFNYPLAAGNSWEYRRVMLATNFRPDSLSILLPDTMYIQVEVQIPVELKDRKKATPIMARSTLYDRELYNIRFYRQDEKGLYHIAYLAGNFVPGLPKAKGLAFKFKGRLYNNLAQMSDALTTEPHLFKSFSDSVIYNTPPSVALKYPLFIGSKWDLTAEYFRIEKTILDYTSVNVPAGDFDVYSIQWLYYFDYADKPDEDLTVFEFISEKGLVKRRLRLLNAVLTTRMGEDIGYFDYYENLELVSYNVAAK